MPECGWEAEPLIPSCFCQFRKIDAPRTPQGRQRAERILKVRLDSAIAVGQPEFGTTGSSRTEISQTKTRLCYRHFGNCIAHAVPCSGTVAPQ
eukprot:3424555-Rhodomonas_salina.3